VVRKGKRDEKHLRVDGKGKSTGRMSFHVNLLHVFDDLEREQQEVSFLLWFQKKEEQTL